jgi:DNA replication protein DnaC
MTQAPPIAGRIDALLRRFKLTVAADEMVPRLVQSGHQASLPVVAEVLECEAEARHHRRVDRLRRGSKLPAAKTFETLDRKRLPTRVDRLLDQLSEGKFLDEAINVLAFGLPGVGKSHALAALGHALVQRGRSVLYAPTYELVQELLAAKRDLALPRLLRKLDQFEVLILDDLGDTKQHAGEAEVLFTLIAERYERRSLVVTSNVVFSQWEQVFQSPMATAAAIDRIVHHSVILEFDGASYRTQAARERQTSAPSSAERSRPAEARSARNSR